jgi:xylulokinase
VNSHVQVLCVDIGTSSIKAGVVDGRGSLLWWHREAFGSQANQTFGDWHAERWVKALQSLFGRIDRHLEIGAVVISGNGPTLVPVGVDGRPVAPVLHWIDTREERVAGQASFFLPKARWFMKHCPEAYEATSRFLSCPDFINRELTGESVSVLPSLDFIKYHWDPDAISAYGLDSGLFPDHIMTGDRIGEVSKAASSRYGIPAKIPVFAGGSDFLMAILGTAAIRNGRTCDRAGTSEGINHCSNVPVESRRLRTLPHAIEGLYNVAGILSSTGRIFEWFRRIAGLDGKAYDQMLCEIVEIGHTRAKPIFLPSLHTGATWEFGGAAFMHLEPEHGATEMGRAVVESIGFAVRDLVETLEENGCTIEELRVSGGQARSGVWNQMKSDITGKPVCVPLIADAELTGNAAAAMTGLGHYQSLSAASEDLVSFASIYEPRAAEHRQFSESYGEFMEVCEMVVGVLADYLNKPSR